MATPPHQLDVLWAAGVWDALLPLIVAGGYFVIKMVVDAAKQQAQGQGRPAPRPMQPPALPRQPQQQPQVGQANRPKTPAEEVEEFLRRAAARKAGVKPQPQPPRPPQPAAQRPQQSQPAVRRLTPQDAPRPKEKPRPTVIEAESVEGPSLTGPRPTGAGVSQHVDQHLDEREFTQRAQQLSHLKQSGGELAEHVKHTFEHRVGTLAATAAAPAAAAPAADSAPDDRSAVPSAAELAALLSRPRDVRTAILLNELLRRPEERW